MITVITRGVRVSVETEYQPEYSNPGQYHFVFTYHISIENRSDYTIRLLTRHWDIHDITFPKREIEGEGVVGKKPVLEPGEIHQYVSGCNLRSGVGKMHGYYSMENTMTGKLFDVAIPEFTMIVPFKLN